MEGVVVFADSRRPARYLNDGSLRSVTDERGRYRIAGLAPGTWYVFTRVTFTRPRRYIPAYPVEVVVTAAEQTRLDISLKAGEVIEGLLIGPDGEPIAHELVETDGLLADRAPSLSFGDLALTASDGSFTLGGLPPGTYTLTSDLRDAEHRFRYLQGSLEVTTGSGPVRFCLERAAVVRGRVTDGTTLPMRRGSSVSAGWLPASTGFASPPEAGRG